MLAAMLVLAAPAQAVQFNVNVTGDVYDNALTPCTGADATDCSLREAVLAANAAATDDEIVLQARRYRLTREGGGGIPAEFGDLDVVANGELTITGPGARSTLIDATGVNDRVVEVHEEVQFFMNGVTITGGNDVFTGGGLNVNGDGETTVATATISDSAIVGNSALQGGGAAISRNGALNLVRSTMSANTATQVGGAIANFFVCGGCTANVMLENSTLSGNQQTAEQDAFAMFDYGGGAISASDDFSFHHSTLANNFAAAGGGAIDANFGTITATNSIVSENTSGEAGQANCDAPITSGDYNLERGTTCGFTQPGDVNANPRLGPLTNNGGPTNTHFPSAFGGAVGNSNPLSCLAIDQRGVTRPQGTACDIGAVEAEPTDVSISIAASPRPAEIEERLVYTLTVRNNGVFTARGVTVTDVLPTRLRPRQAAASQGSCSGGRTKICSLGAIAPGETAVVTIGTLPRQLGLVSNTGTVIMANPNTNGGNDSASTTVQVNLRSGPCANVQTGNASANTLAGTNAGDRLVGRGGNDTLRGRRGADCLVGGAGRDKLFGARGRDKLSGGSAADELRGGPAKDSYNGGRGDDRINAADGIGETVRCGPGDDRAIVDSIGNEVVRDCEVVTRVRLAARRY